MHAKAPLDVDLEDRLLYGLTPIRLAYLVVALLSGFAVWQSPWAPSPIRAVAGLTVVVAGAVAAWGRWRGRAADSWLADISIFAINTHRLTLSKSWLERLKRRQPHSQPLRLSKNPLPITIVVAARGPKAGAATVTNELEACLAADRWSVNRASADRAARPNPACLLLSIAAVDHGPVCYLDRGEGPSVAGAS
jgi:hypothetical protein